MLIINHRVIVRDAGQTCTPDIFNLWTYETQSPLMKTSSASNIYSSPLKTVEISCQPMQPWTVVIICTGKAKAAPCSGPVAWKRRWREEGGGGLLWGGALCYLGHPPLQHIISNQPQSSQQPAHIRRADLKVISTDKFRETVIRGISQAVFV